MIALVFFVLGCAGEIGDRASDGPAPDVRPPSEERRCTGLCLGESRVPRITRAEYVASVRAALGDATADTIRTEFLPPDDAAGPFTSNGFLPIDRDGVGAYASVAADTAAAIVFADLATCDPAAIGEAECALETVARVGRVLFRRPLSDAELAPYRTLFDTARADGSFDEAIELVMTGLLQSPYFLYQPEIGLPTETPSIVKLTGREIAARLSLYLWNGSPDDALLAAADSGALDTAEGVTTEARRLLDDARADDGIALFFAEWLGISSVATHELDALEYPDFAAYAPHLAAETTGFALRVMRDGDASLATMLTADWTVASTELAPLYGSSTPGADGVLALDGTRAGLLTQGSFLVAHTHDPSTAAVHRGKAVRERFLCQTLPPPPPVDAVITPDPELSTRQRLEAKTAPEGCAACHSLMNPIGFAFGHYDPMGAYRELDGTHEVDATGVVAQSDVAESFDGAIELASLLAESDDVRRCIVRQWLRYALGRYDTIDDESSVDAAYGAYERSGFDLNELVVAVTGTDAFRYRRLPQE
jgi:hypothetical protein